MFFSIDLKNINFFVINLRLKDFSGLKNIYLLLVTYVKHFRRALYMHDMDFCLFSNFCCVTNVYCFQAFKYKTINN